MIVLSDTLVLTPAPALDLDAPIIGYHNVVTAQGISADLEDIEHPAIYLANPLTAQRWRSLVIGEQYITGVVDEVGTLDYYAIASHNLGSAQIPISFERRTEFVDSSGNPEYEEIVQEVLLPDDRPALFRFEEQGLAGYRIRLQEGNAEPTIAVLNVGKLLVLPHRLYVGHSPLPFGRRVNSATGLSQSGHFLGTTVTGSYVETGVDLSNLPPDFYRARFDPFLETALGLGPATGTRSNVPFFWAWRPLSYPREVGYCWLREGSQPRPTNQRTNGMMSIHLDLTGVA